jgi:hypothetical protein
MIAQRYARATFIQPKLADIKWRRLIRENNDGSIPGEAPMRVSQVEIEPMPPR